MEDARSDKTKKRESEERGDDALISLAQSGDKQATENCF